MGMGGQSWYSWMSEHIGSTVASTAIGMTIMGVAGYYGCKAAGWISGKNSSMSQLDDPQSNQGGRLPPIEMLDKYPESCPRGWQRGQAYTGSFFSSTEKSCTISRKDKIAIRQALQNFNDHPDIQEGTDLTFTTDQQLEDAYYLQSVKTAGDGELYMTSWGKAMAMTPFLATLTKVLPIQSSKRSGRPRRVMLPRLTKSTSKKEGGVR
jgi:hypothetical protein